MAFYRIKRVGKQKYLYYVKSVRNGKKVRQEVIQNLGNVKKLKRLLKKIK